MTVDGLTVGACVVGGPGFEGHARNTEAAPDEVSGPFLTVAEVARRMRVSKMTIYRLVHSGALPANRFGGTFRVQRVAVEELILSARYQAG